MHAKHCCLPIVVLHVVALVRPAACSWHCLLALLSIVLVPVMIVLYMQSCCWGGG